MSTNERRAEPRRRVFLSAKATNAMPQAHTHEVQAVVRDMTEIGACVEFDALQSPRGEIDLAIPRKSRTYRSKVIWTRENKAGVAFQTDAPLIAPDEAVDAETKLRQREREMRALRSRLRELSGGG